MAPPPHAIGRICISNRSFWLWLAVECSWRNSCLLDNHSLHLTLNINTVAIEKLNLCSWYIWYISVSTKSSIWSSSGLSWRMLLWPVRLITLNTSPNFHLLHFLWNSFWILVSALCKCYLFVYEIVCNPRLIRNSLNAVYNESGRVSSAAEQSCIYATIIIMHCSSFLITCMAM